jgi:hypothetical protein
VAGVVVRLLVPVVVVTPEEGEVRVITVPSQSTLIFLRGYTR